MGQGPVGDYFVQTSTAVGDKVWLVGGSYQHVFFGIPVASYDVFIYDTRTNLFETPTITMPGTIQTDPNGLLLHTATLLPDGKRILVRPSRFLCLHQDKETHLWSQILGGSVIFNNAIILNTETRSWEPVVIQGWGDLTPRGGHTALKLDNQIFVFGGAQSLIGDTSTNEFIIIDITTGTN